MKKKTFSCLLLFTSSRADSYDWIFPGSGTYTKVNANLIEIYIGANMKSNRTSLFRVISQSLGHLSFYVAQLQIDDSEEEAEILWR